MKNFEKTRTHSILRKMYELFGPRPKRGPLKRLLANECLLQLKGSNVSIIKARRIAGIKSTKIAGHWCWLYPKRTFEEALIIIKSKLPDATASDKKTTDAGFELKKILTRNMYMVPAKTVFNELRRLKIEPRYIFKAKTKLGVDSVRKDGAKKSFWVWPGPDAMDWLLQYLKKNKGWVPVEQTLKAARRESWPPEVIHRAALKAMIAMRRKDSVLYFDDRVNIHSTPEREESESTELIEGGEPEFIEI